MKSQGFSAIELVPASLVMGMLVLAAGHLLGTLLVLAEHSAESGMTLHGLETVVAGFREDPFAVYLMPLAGEGKRPVSIASGGLGFEGMQGATTLFLRGRAETQGGTGILVVESRREQRPGVSPMWHLLGWVIETEETAAENIF
jgi:hypothetical protein